MQLKGAPRFGAKAFFISLLGSTALLAAAHFVLPSADGVALLPQALIATFVMHYGLANLYRTRSGAAFAIAGGLLALACAVFDFRVATSTPFDVFAAILIGGSTTVALLSTHPPMSSSASSGRDQEPRQAV